MTVYHPDSWAVIKIFADDPHYRVLGGWSGGYTQGDSWRLNSGITKFEHRLEDDKFIFHGSSGSIYTCSPHRYGLKMSTAGTYNKLKELHGDVVSLMDGDTDWATIDWIIS